MSTPPIKRIARIAEHRLFREFAWQEGLPDFGRFNLIYGWNGSGKTTLASIFDALGRRNDIPDAGVRLVVGDQDVSSSAFSTAAGLPKVRVFTRDLVDASVLKGGAPLAPIYYFGEANVEKQQRLDSLKREMDANEQTRVGAQAEQQQASRELDRLCIEQAKLIKDLLTAPGSPYNTYEKRRVHEACGTLDRGSLASLLLKDDEKIALGQQSHAQPKPEIESIPSEIPDLSALTARIGVLLQRTVLTHVIEALARDSALAEWVKTGMALHSGARPPVACKFCGNVLSPVRIQALEAHFNDEVKAFSAELSDAQHAVEDSIRNAERLTLPDSARLHEHLVVAYRDAEGALRSALLDVKDALSALNAAVSAKKGKLFESISLTKFAHGEMSGAHKAAAEKVSELNSLIGEHNAHVQDFERQVASARRRLELCMVAEAYPRYAELTTRLHAAEGTASTADAEAVRLGQEMADLERALSEHLTPASELNSELRSFLGRVDIVLEAKDTGYSITRRGAPALNLSEGERTAIAFLHFLKSLRDRSFSLDEGVVVIDDPVSSLDCQAVFTAFAYMKERTKGAGQLFILTHDFQFFRETRSWFHRLRRTWKKNPDNRVCLYMLDRQSLSEGDRATLLALPKLLEEHHSDYHYLFRCVYEASKLESSPTKLHEFYPLPNLARRLLEAFLAFRCPAITGDNDFYKRLDSIAFDDAKKTRILRLLNSLSHENRIGGSDHDMSLLAEAPQIMADIMALMQSEDGKHYDQMVSCLGTGVEDGAD